MVILNHLAIGDAISESIAFNFVHLALIWQTHVAPQSTLLAHQCTSSFRQSGHQKHLQRSHQGERAQGIKGCILQLCHRLESLTSENQGPSLASRVGAPLRQSCSQKVGDLCVGHCGMRCHRATGRTFSPDLSVDFLSQPAQDLHVPITGDSSCTELSVHHSTSVHKKNHHGFGC